MRQTYEVDICDHYQYRQVVCICCLFNSKVRGAWAGAAYN